MLPPCVIRTIPRPPADVASALAEQGVATVHEAQRQQGLMQPAIRSLLPGRRVCGPAVTALNHAGDNLMVHAALEVCQPGDVLVITAKTPCTDGMIGELLACSAKARGVAGIILDVGARDLTLLQEISLPVWARAVSAAGTAKATPGWVNVPVVCGGTTVRPGDLVVADDDGVVVVAHERATDVLAAARARTQKEESVRPRLEAGELSLDIYGFRKVLEAGGVRYYDSAEQALADAP
jgi:4-hydroxy-4-methyl-2-oxoglutarate aldolase